MKIIIVNVQVLGVLDPASGSVRGDDAGGFGVREEPGALVRDRQL